MIRDIHSTISAYSQKQITEITLSTGVRSCCSHKNYGTGYTFKLEEPITVEDLEQDGISQFTSLKAEGRPLTINELELVMPIFKNSIDYSKVRVHKGEFLWFGIQDDYTAMTPEGDMYFPEEIYEDDFAFVNPYLFIHEMVHVWQYQLGYNVLWNGFLIHFLKLGFLSKGTYGYQHLLNQRTDLSDFNMEQQGNIIADYFIKGYSELKDILYGFKINPNNSLLLPKTTAVWD